MPSEILRRRTAAAMKPQHTARPLLTFVSNDCKDPSMTSPGMFERLKAWLSPEPSIQVKLVALKAADLRKRSEIKADRIRYQADEERRKLRGH